MRYTVEIDDSTTNGKEALTFLRKIRSADSVVIRKFKKLKDEEMGLPGPRASKWQMEEWLSRPDKDKGISLEALDKKVKARVKATINRSKGG